MLTPYLTFAAGRRSSLRTGRRLSAQVISNLNTGEEIYEALQASTDQASFEAALSHKQMSLLNEHQRRKQEELHSEMQAEFRAKLDEFEEKVGILWICVQII